MCSPACSGRRRRRRRRQPLPIMSTTPTPRSPNSSGRRGVTATLPVVSAVQATPPSSPSIGEATKEVKPNPKMSKALSTSAKRWHSFFKCSRAFTYSKADVPFLLACRLHNIPNMCTRTYWNLRKKPRLFT